MMKILLGSICSIAFGFCLAMPAQASSGLQLPSSEVLQKEKGQFEASWTPPAKNSYVKVVAKDTAQTFGKEKSDYKTVLQDAVMFHNLMHSVTKQKGQLEAFRLAVLDKEISKARVADFDRCNEEWLSSYFASPNAVWNKLKNETDKRIK